MKIDEEGKWLKEINESWRGRKMINRIHLKFYESNGFNS